MSSACMDFPAAAGDGCAPYNLSFDSGVCGYLCTFLSERHAKHQIPSTNYCLVIKFLINHAQPQSGLPDSTGDAPAASLADCGASGCSQCLSLPAQPGDGVPALADGVGCGARTAGWGVGAQRMAAA